MQGKAVPEDNGPVPHHDELGLGKPTIYRITKERFDRSDEKFGELTEKMRVTKQCLAGLEHEARQSRLVMEAIVEPDMKTHTRADGASVAD